VAGVFMPRYICKYICCREKKEMDSSERKIWSYARAGKLGDILHGP